MPCDTKYVRVERAYLDERMCEFERDWGFTRAGGYGQLGPHPTPAQAMAYGAYDAMRDLLEDGILPVWEPSTLRIP